MQAEPYWHFCQKSVIVTALLQSPNFSPFWSILLPLSHSSLASFANTQTHLRVLQVLVIHQGSDMQANCQLSRDARRKRQGSSFYCIKSHHSSVSLCYLAADSLMDFLPCSFVFLSYRESLGLTSEKGQGVISLDETGHRFLWANNETLQLV